MKQTSNTGNANDKTKKQRGSSISQTKFFVVGLLVRQVLVDPHGLGLLAGRAPQVLEVPRDGH